MGEKFPLKTPYRRFVRNKEEKFLVIRSAVWSIPYCLLKQAIGSKCKSQPVFINLETGWLFSCFSALKCKKSCTARWFYFTLTEDDRESVIEAAVEARIKPIAGSFIVFYGELE
ncbi:hypothetical protein [Paenibacillus rhizophilus]|uniref:Uncharacterized protein n=1 Tax=Paenibacillus rhizophilus TaxID=1850366 RepID=A0A3N9P973_9BACL|nr:hypothetical protein [Paenibacillus rhizophilus]RQW12788.1 hypothetical protein EH198_07030 [Paenibacillus rhizophilus]